MRFKNEIIVAIVPKRNSTL